MRLVTESVGPPHMVAAMATFDGMPPGPAGTARLWKRIVPWLRVRRLRGVLVLIGDESTV